MKKILLIIIALLIATTAYSENEWRNKIGENTILGTESVNDIDAKTFENIVDPLDRVLANHRQGAALIYNSASSIDIESGEVVCSNAGGTIRKMRKNNSTTNVVWGDIDAGAEASGTTYYVYAIADADATTFTAMISANSSTPTGATVFKRLGSFVNDSSSNITEIDNDAYKGDIGIAQSKSYGTVYQALTDGFVVGQATWSSGSVASFNIKSDSVSTPTTIRCADGGTSSGFVMSCGTFVKKGDYYKMLDASNTTAGRTLYFYPLN